MPGMPTPPYASPAPAAAEIAALPGPTLLEFGVDWCGHCRTAMQAVGSALAAHPAVRHLRIEDGPGRPLGRSFKVTLWPTLVLLVDGRELARLVRPTSAAAVALALSVIDPIA
jgi:thioredoxin 1